ncbi:MAG: DUF4157 domain-containing protein [Desulfocapsa sp.]|nr:DUF4157 domain-containing protein [Desulfocapsa sp.]
MGKIRSELRPHTVDHGLLKKSSVIYGKGKTPQIDTSGRLTEINVKPCGPELAAKHLQSIKRIYGASGVQKTIIGLQATRGNQFVSRIMEISIGANAVISNEMQKSTKAPVPDQVENIINSSKSGIPLRAKEQVLMKNATRKDPKNVRLYNNQDSHEAAESIGARAFTVGQNIYFGKGQYNPEKTSGRELLAHEVAHAFQQERAPMPPVGSMKVSSPGDHLERQADQIARSVIQFDKNKAANTGLNQDDEVASNNLTTVTRTNVARIHRAISFTTAEGAFTTNNMSKAETAAGFRFQADVQPLFQWQPDVTIHGNAGDSFADWETAHHQVGKSFWRNVYWGTGGNRTRRRFRINGGLPMRDATAAGNTWYHDPLAQGFAASGDTRSPNINDSPASARHPWNNPVAGRVGDSGWFNYGFGFVATLSARHTPTGTAAAAFRHLDSVHWNFGIAGNFDASRPLGTRVNITSGGPINRSGVFSGHDPTNPPMHGGDIINNNFAHTDT